MNREITGGAGASIYPLIGDVISQAGNDSVSVTGLLGVPMQAVGTDDQEFLVYDQSTNNWIPRLIAPPDLPIATTSSLGAVQPDGTTVTVSVDGVISASNSTTLDLETNGTPNSTQTLLNLKAGPNITLAEVAGTVTITAATPIGSSTIIESWGPQTAITGNGTYQTILSYVIPANTIPAGKGIEFDFFSQGTGVGFATNSWQVSFAGNTLLWNELLDATGAAWGGCRIVNLPSVTNAQTLVLNPLQVNTSSGGINAQWAEATFLTLAVDTTIDQTFLLQWNGPSSIGVEIIQAFVKFI